MYGNVTVKTIDLYNLYALSKKVKDKIRAKGFEEYPKY